MLTALLGLPLGKLSNAERKAFQQMYDLLATGGAIGLSHKQRQWADGVYDKHDLDKPRAEGARKVTVKDPSRLSPLDNLPKPTKPPGRS